MPVAAIGTAQRRESTIRRSKPGASIGSLTEITRDSFRWLAGTSTGNAWRLVVEVRARRFHVILRGSASVVPLSARLASAVHGCSQARGAPPAHRGCARLTPFCLPGLYLRPAGEWSGSGRIAERCSVSWCGGQWANQIPFVVLIAWGRRDRVFSGQARKSLYRRQLSNQTISLAKS